MPDSSVEFEELAVPIIIGVVADTHRSSRRPRALPAELVDGLHGVDLILHAGDVCAPWVVDELAELAPVRAVHGNNDEPPLDRELPGTLRFLVGGWRIAMVHGHRSRLSAREAVRAEFTGEVDCVVYGHSHYPEVERRDGLLMVNPGSPTQRRFAPYRSYAIMRVDREIRVNLVSLD